MKNRIKSGTSEAKNHTFITLFIPKQTPSLQEKSSIFIARKSAFLQASGPMFENPAKLCHWRSWLTANLWLSLEFCIIVIRILRCSLPLQLIQGRRLAKSKGLRTSLFRISSWRCLLLKICICQVKNRRKSKGEVDCPKCLLIFTKNTPFLLIFY